jgi:hypothetical protein
MTHMIRFAMFILLLMLSAAEIVIAYINRAAIAAYAALTITPLFVGNLVFAVGVAFCLTGAWAAMRGLK